MQDQMDTNSSEALDICCQIVFYCAILHFLYVFKYLCKDDPFRGPFGWISSQCVNKCIFRFYFLQELSQDIFFNSLPNGFPVSISSVSYACIYTEGRETKENTTLLVGHQQWAAHLGLKVTQGECREIMVAFLLFFLSLPLSPAPCFPFSFVLIEHFTQSLRHWIEAAWGLESGSQGAEITE